MSVGSVVHCKRGKPFDLYVGRPSKWGNPWSHKFGTGAQFIVKNVEEAVRCFEDWLEGKRFTDTLQTERQAIMDSYPEIVGLVLACWCEDDKPCHAKVLVRLAQKYAGDRTTEADSLEGDSSSLREGEDGDGDVQRGDPAD